MSISPCLWLAMTIPCKRTRLDPYNILCIKDDSGHAEVLVQHLAPSAWVAETVFGWVGLRRHWKALLESCQHEKVKNHPLRYHRKFMGNRSKTQSILRNLILCGEQIKYLVRPIVFQAGPHNKTARPISQLHVLFSPARRCLVFYATC